MLCRGTIDHKTAFWKLLLFRCVCVRPPWKRRVTNRVTLSLSSLERKEKSFWKGRIVLARLRPSLWYRRNKARALTAKGSQLVLNHPQFTNSSRPHSIKPIVISQDDVEQILSNIVPFHTFSFSKDRVWFGTLWILLETFDSSLIFSLPIIGK